MCSHYRLQITGPKLVGAFACSTMTVSQITILQIAEFDSKAHSEQGHIFWSLLQVHLRNHGCHQRVTQQFVIRSVSVYCKTVALHFHHG